MFCKALISLSFLFCSAVSFAADTDASYQQEFIFLKTQVAALKSRRAKTVSRLQSLNSSLKKEVFTLGDQVSTLRTKNESLKTRLSKFDENRSDKDMVLKKTEVVSSQMRDFVNNHVDAANMPVEEVNLFVLGFLKKGAALTEEKGFAYNEAGKKVKVQILNVGHIAAFAKTDKGLEPLAASADKKDLFLTGEQTLDFNDADQGLVTSTVVLKEGGVQAKAPTLTSVLKEKLKSGGAVGYIIILLGFIGVGIAFIRYSLIRSYNVLDDSGIRDVVKRIQMGELETAKTILGTQNANPLTRFVEKLISFRHNSDEVYEAIVIEEISKVQSRVSKYGPYLIVLAAVAPLLGLLGTVTGMIGTFDMITIHGTGNPKLLSGGIKEALVTTQMGLIVAIPCILAGNYLSSRALKVVSKFEEVASTLPKFNS
jgi:biopolymer transport protein ExbB